MNVVISGISLLVSVVLYVNTSVRDLKLAFSI